MAHTKHCDLVIFQSEPKNIVTHDIDYVENDTLYVNINGSYSFC